MSYLNSLINTLNDSDNRFINKITNLDNNKLYKQLVSNIKGFLKYRNDVFKNAVNIIILANYKNKNEISKLLNQRLESKNTFDNNYIKKTAKSISLNEGTVQTINTEFNNKKIEQNKILNEWITSNIDNIKNEIQKVEKPGEKPLAIIQKREETLLEKIAKDPNLSYIADFFKYRNEMEKTYFDGISTVLFNKEEELNVWKNENDKIINQQLIEMTSSTLTGNALKNYFITTENSRKAKTIVLDIPEFKDWLNMRENKMAKLFDYWINNNYKLPEKPKVTMIAKPVEKTAEEKKDKCKYDQLKWKENENALTEFAFLKRLYPSLREPLNLKDFDKNYFYIYFSKDVDLDIILERLGIDEELAFISNKYGDREYIIKIILCNFNNKDKLELELLKHLFNNSTTKQVDYIDIVYLVSFKYFKGITPTLFKLIVQRCENINISQIGFNYLDGKIGEGDILSILINCNGFCDFGFGDPSNSDIKRLYKEISNEKLKFIEFFCKKSNINCVKGLINYKTITDSNMIPFHLAIWMCGLTICDIITFYLENNISNLPTPLNFIKYLEIPLNFLCEQQCINMLVRNPASLLSDDIIAFVKKLMNDCNPRVCSLIKSKTGILSVLKGTGFEFITIPGKFMCDTICCGHGSESICECCSTLRVRDLRNKFSIYKKIAMCLTNFVCEMTKKGDVLNDVFGANELRQIILFLCNLIQNPDFRSIVNQVENVMNTGIKVVLDELEKFEKISFDRLFDLMVGNLQCTILKTVSSSLLGSDAGKMIGWVCDRFSDPPRCILKKIIRAFDVTSGKVNIPDVPGMIFECLSPCDILGKVSEIRFLRDMCDSCSGMARNFAVSVMKGQMPDLTSGIIDCIGGCGIIRKALGGSPWINAICDGCGGAVNGFARAALTGNLRMDDIISKAYQCLSPCGLIRFVGDQMGPGGRSLGCMCDFDNCPCPINYNKCPCPVNPTKCHIHWPHIHWPHAHSW